MNEFFLWVLLFMNIFRGHFFSLAVFFFLCQEPITLSEQLPCAGVTAFLRISLFLERFWREF